MAVCVLICVNRSNMLISVIQERPNPEHPSCANLLVLITGYGKNQDKCINDI